jgi:hypothetical protein
MDAFHISSAFKMARPAISGIPERSSPADIAHVTLTICPVHALRIGDSCQIR